MPGLSSVIRWTLPTSSSGLGAAVVRCNRLIEAYFKKGLLQKARQMFDEMPERNVFTWNTMISGYVKNNDLGGARLLFDAAPERDPVTYNSLISGYAREGCNGGAVELFAEMRQRGNQPDQFTLTMMLNVAADMLDPYFGRQLHACVVKAWNDSDSFGMSSLIDMYSKCGCFSNAVEVFQGAGGNVDPVSKNAMVASCCREGRMDMAFDLFHGVTVSNDVVSWNTLISGCVQNGRAELALELFVGMWEDGVRWNEHTIASILGACSCLKWLNYGKQVHAWVLKNDMSSNSFISSGLVNFYCKCDELQYAEAVHAETCQGNVFAMTSMIVGHAGRGNMEEARRLFDSLDEKNSVALTALLSGYLQSQQYEAVFKHLREFIGKVETLIPDELVFVNVLIACSLQADLDHGRQVHAYMIRMGFKMEEKLGSALLDMYAKCGELKSATRIFENLSCRDRVIYNAMLAGFAHHGREKEALGLFEEMMSKGVRPDSVTFIAILSACRHGGLVEAGEKCFNAMKEDYGISSEIDHYSCMVDLYCRANQLDKAMSLIKNMPFEPDAIIWGTFLNACRTSGNTDVAKEVEEKLLRMEAHSGARYVQLANAFAAEGKWREVERIRGKMRGREAKKHAGCSWVHVDSRVNTFTSGDSSHSEADAIYAMLATMSAEMEDEITLV
ncbi:hypothetical protein Taro_008056 [Colocasia esculenta]|uniref:Pentatricopeptide repeat-containing protein n=1 Tax=Colocasia esculenta TaxID=4460 RepID=A0A843TWM5_COLES|nr:hypothetical protein [Colocasia esculenta]